MKKIVLTLAVMLSTALSAFSLTLKEAYDQIKALPDLQGVQTFSAIYEDNGWVSSIPFESAETTAKIHEVGDGQTVYYGSHVEELQRQLPKSQLALGAADYANLLYIYYNPVDGQNSELLILIDQAYQGKTTAIYGKVSNQVVNALKAAKVEFTHTHDIVVWAPMLVCS